MNINQDFLIAAGFRFESERGIPHSPFEMAEVEKAGLANVSPDELAHKIWSWLDGEGACSELRNSAFWALGKRFNARDRDRLVAALPRELHHDIESAYQVMIALDNLEEPVFGSERKGHSALNHAENRADAERYLRTLS